MPTTVTIYVRRTATGYDAAHYNEAGQPSSEIIALFGTHVVPIGFTERASLSYVLTELGNRNPGVAVKPAQ